MKFIFVSIILINSINSFSQDQTLGLPTPIDTVLTVKDTILELNYNTEQKGAVKVIKDERLDQVTEFIGRQSESITGSLIDGYRIQIFFNESRNIAQSQKAGFMNSHSEHKAYIDYLAPNYRIRVGNFRTKLQAEKFKQELINVYPTCIILKNKIELPVLMSTSENL